MKGFIFDMDGTLVENMAFHFLAFEKQAEHHGYELLRPITSRYYGWHNRDIMPETIPAEVIERLGLDFLSDEKEAIYRELYAGNVKLTAGLDELLADAKRCGIRCAVGSAGPRVNVEFIMREGDLFSRMDAYVCADDVTRCKPDPEIFLKSCAKLNLDPSDCVVFEDAVSGIEAGRAAGCRTVGITTTISGQALLDAGADFVVPDFRVLTVAEIERRLATRRP